MHPRPLETVKTMRTDQKSVRIERVNGAQPYRVVIVWHGRTQPAVYCRTLEAAEAIMARHV
jgi:hypothetical protein